MQRGSAASLCAILALAAAVAFTGGGCSTVDTTWNAAVKHPYVPTNYVSAGPLDASVRRVALLPVHSAEWRASDLASIDSAMESELGKYDRFEVIPVGRARVSDLFGRETWLSTGSLPEDMLARIREETGADAVLFLDLTHYSPYQPIAIGMRSRLVAVADGRELWSFDAMFDAAQPDVAEAARRYHVAHSRPAYPLENTAAILQSPARYAKYVAWSMFGTLPPRTPR